MPTDPSQEILEYFRSKAASVPTGVPIDNEEENEEEDAGENDPPVIDLNIPPLDQTAYLSEKSTIFDYIDQEYINEKQLKDNAILNVDELNARFTTDLSQQALDKKLNEIIQDSGGNNGAIYSSLSYTGLSSIDLKDYLKITLRKPSATDERSQERRLNSLENSSEFLDSLFRLNTEGGILGGFFDSIGLGDTINAWADNLNIGEVAEEYTTDFQNFIRNAVLGSAEGIFKSEELQSKLTEIYGEDGAVELFLPLPMEIWENYEHQIEQANLSGVNQIANTLATAQAQFAAAGRIGLATARLAGLTGFKSFAGTNVAGLDQYISGLQGSMDFISSETRKTFNPVQEQLYRTPQPREFQWSIRIWPTSQEQALSIALIIQALKEHSSPINLGDLFYDFPGFIEFEFYINNKLAPFLPRSLYYDRERKIKVPSFIKSVQVQYTGTDLYGHFVDGFPTSYVITLSIVETQPLDRNILVGDMNNNSAVAQISDVNDAFTALALRANGTLPIR